MVDEGGHQLAHIQYPGLPADEIIEAVHRFYDEYYFRPKAVFRILRKAAFNNTDRKRLYKEAKAFLKARAMRHKWVKDKREKDDSAAAVAACQGLGSDRVTFRKYLVLAGVTLCASIGDSLLSRGMKQVGSISLHHLADVILAVLNPSVALGILLLLGFFASYMTALSWADLTYVLPATSLGYVLLALIAKFYLHER